MARPGEADARRARFRERWLSRKWDWYEFDGRTVLSCKVWRARFGVELRREQYFAWLRPPRPAGMPLSQLPRWIGGNVPFTSVDEAQLALFDYAWPEGSGPRFEQGGDHE